MSKRRLSVAGMAAIAASAFLYACGGDGSGVDTLATSQTNCATARDIQLVNGKIATMAAGNPIVSSANIKNGRFVAVGDQGDRSATACTRVIDLGGRTVIPGLVDNHMHFVALGRRPGYDTPIETAASIADLQQLIRARALQAPQGEFITTIGGWNVNQFAENRMPTLAELDAAAPKHSVLITSAATRGATNSLGKAFFQAQNVTVGPNGELSTNADTLRAVFLLKNALTLDQLKRGTQDAMSWAAGLGLTTVMDMGSNVFTGTETDSIGAFSPYTGYDPVLALSKEDKLKIRLRLNYITLDTTAELPLLTARLQNAFRNFGNDMLKTVCMGESVWTLSGPGAVGQGVPAAPYADAVRKVAERGECYEQHSLTLASDKAITDVWEKVNAAIPIKDFRWRVAHVPFIDQPTVNRLKAMGAGLTLHAVLTSGPPYRMIVDSGIQVGAGSDGRNSLPGNPWTVLQYMVTGKDRAGALINVGQTLTRAEALRLYTVANGWFSNEEDLLGSVEVGKLADVAVLSNNFLDAVEVPDDSIGRLTSLLTIVDGKVVHDTGAIKR